MQRSGTADLPLHYGRVPQWLAERMTLLGREITLTLIEEEGTAGVLTRLANPFWFQALGAVMGMDWHSSGITTSVMGALKRGLNPLADQTGLHFCGGRGRQSVATPSEITLVAEKTGRDPVSLIDASRLSAKVDNTCVQDGFSLYLHCFVLSREGDWTVVQQGMNDSSRLARRYHWHSATLTDFLSDPQTGIVGRNVGTILNLSDSRANRARDAITDFIRHPPALQLRELRSLMLPATHHITRADVDAKRLGGVLTLAWERQCSSFVQTLLLPGVGPRTLQSLALVAEVIYGAPCRFSDPARFSFALGGKDGHPFPVPLTVYDETIDSMRNGIARARLGHSDKTQALRALHTLATRIEKLPGVHADSQRVIERERACSRRYGGKTVAGPCSSISRRKTTPASREVQQLSLDLD